MDRSWWVQTLTSIRWIRPLASALSTSLDQLSRIRGKIDKFAENRIQSSMLHVLRPCAELLFLVCLLLLQYWVENNMRMFGDYEIHAAFRDVIIGNFVSAVLKIWGDNNWKSVPIAFVTSVAVFQYTEYIWDLHPGLVGVLLILPQMLDVRVAVQKSCEEKSAADDFGRQLEELKGELNAKNKYIEQLTVRKKNELILRPPPQKMIEIESQHKDSSNEMEKKMKELEIIARNAVQEREKIEKIQTEKEELEREVKQLRNIQNDMKKKHKTETSSQKENLSRAVSHSHDLKTKVAALRDENLRLTSVEDELRALQRKFEQVLNDLERERKRYKSVLAANQKLKDDLASRCNQQLEMKSTVDPPQSKQHIDDIFFCVKEIFPMIKRETVLLELVDLRKREGGKFVAGKALTVGRIVKSLADKLGTQIIRTEVSDLPNGSCGEKEYSNMGKEGVKCDTY